MVTVKIRKSSLLVITLLYQNIVISKTFSKRALDPFMGSSSNLTPGNASSNDKTLEETINAVVTEAMISWRLATEDDKNSRISDLEDTNKKLLDYQVKVFKEVNKLEGQINSLTDEVNNLKTSGLPAAPTSAEDKEKECECKSRFEKIEKDITTFTNAVNVQQQKNSDAINANNKFNLQMNSSIFELQSGMEKTQADITEIKKVSDENGVSINKLEIVNGVNQIKFENIDSQAKMVEEKADAAKVKMGQIATAFENNIIPGFKSLSAAFNGEVPETKEEPDLPSVTDAVPESTTTTEAPIVINTTKLNTPEPTTAAELTTEPPPAPTTVVNSSDAISQEPATGETITNSDEDDNDV